MTSFFEVALDTQTQLDLQINGGNDSTENTTVTLELDFEADAIEAKIWGDINPLDPMNEEFAETEGDAQWITISPSFLVALTTNPGPKTLHARIRDDVWNEATDSAMIRVGEEVAPPPVRPTQRPKLVPGKPEPRRRAPLEAQEVVVTSRVRLRTSAEVAAARSVGSDGVRIRPGSLELRASTATDSDGFLVSTRVRSYITRDAATSSIAVGAATTATIRRGDDPDLEALMALDLL